MSPQLLKETLRTRVIEFGEKPSYVLFPDELELGREYGLFTSGSSQDRGDGTTITKVTFEEKMFICASEN